MGKNWVVLVADEALLKFQATLAAVWSQRGEQPKVYVIGERKKKSFYGALNVRSGKHYVHMCDKQNQKETVKFLKQIIRKIPGKKILLLWDNAPWHRGEIIRSYLHSIKRLELMTFPAYSPELNPEERVWKQARKDVSHNHNDNNFERLSRKFRSYLQRTVFRTNFWELYKV